MVTESMRNRLRAQGIEAPRGACDGGKSGAEVSAYPHPGVFVRVARKGLTRRGVRKSGKQTTYREALLRFGATEEFAKGYTSVMTGSMRNGLRPQGIEAPRDARDGGHEA